jgi:hypothetical protein
VKLTERDKRRAQWAVLSMLAVAGVIYGSINLFIRPLRQSRTTAMNKMAALQEQIDQAELDLKDLESIQAEVDRLQAGLAATTNRYVLRPLLAGNLLDPLQNLVEPMAREHGIKIDSWSERGRTETPVNKKDATMLIDRYQIELSMTAPYAMVRDFVLALERTNSYVCVTDLELIGQAADVQRHKVRMGMEWPVFGVPVAQEASPGRARGAAGRP